MFDSRNNCRIVFIKCEIGANRQQIMDVNEQCKNIFLLLRQDVKGVPSHREGPVRDKVLEVGLNMHSMQYIKRNYVNPQTEL